MSLVAKFFSHSKIQLFPMLTGIKKPAEAGFY
jgi:hypothetical protein